MQLILLRIGASCFPPAFDGALLATEAGGALRFDHLTRRSAYPLAALRLLCCMHRTSDVKK